MISLVLSLLFFHLKYNQGYMNRGSLKMNLLYSKKGIIHTVACHPMVSAHIESFPMEKNIPNANENIMAPGSWPLLWPLQYQVDATLAPVTPHIKLAMRRLSERF